VNRSAVVARCISVGATAGLGYAQWRITTPGAITFTEWRVMLLTGGVALIVTLSASWVSRGAPDRDTYTDRENDRPIRPPWA
jgi:hypothetical protein